MVVNLATIKKSEDPKSELLEKLRVVIVENTNLIRIALELPNPEEAVTIVQAVVQSYLTQNTDYSRSANRDLTESLKQQLLKIGTEIDLKRSTLKDLYKKGNVAVLKPELNVNNNDGNPSQPTFKVVSEDHVQKMMAELDETDFELIEAMSTLEVKREAYKVRQQEIQQPTHSTDRQQQARVEEEFKKDPDVLASNKSLTTHVSVLSILSILCDNLMMRQYWPLGLNSTNYSESITICGPPNIQ